LWEGVKPVRLDSRPVVVIFVVCVLSFRAAISMGFYLLFVIRFGPPE
jgi:hypothetical protein